MVSAYEKHSRLTWLAFAVAALSLIGPLNASGIWDPYELEVAELARRIALNLLGGSGLEIAGADNRVPILSELGRGQLPFTSIALGFRVFGLHVWAGRIPMLLWGVVGLGATYALMAKLADRRVGAFSVIVMATTPLYFVQARTMLGDIVTMASHALAVCGLGVAVFDPHARRRVLWLGVGALALLTGFLSRGMLLGVALPLLAVGLSFVIASANGLLRLRPLWATALGALCLGLGLCATAVGAQQVLSALSSSETCVLCLGMTLEKTRELETFDHVVRYLGHSQFPYSALLPLAVGRLSGLGVTSRADGERSALLVTLLLTTSGLGLLFYGLLAPHAGPLAFGPVFALSGIVGLCFRDLERDAKAAPMFAVLALSLLVILVHDLISLPQTNFSPFALADATFPESFAPSAEKLLLAASGACGLIFYFAVTQSGSEQTPSLGFERYAAYFRFLHGYNRGSLWVGFWMTEATLLGLFGMLLLSDRFLHIPHFEQLSTLSRRSIELGFILLPLLVWVLVPAWLFLRDVMTLVFSPAVGGLLERFPRLSRWQPTRALAASLAMVMLGLCMSLSYYPQLGSQLSPQDLFDKYDELARPNEPLATLGVSASAASYHTGRAVTHFDDASSALRWLTSETTRRFMIVRSEELPDLNSAYRARAAGARQPQSLTHRVPPPAKNLPVVDASSSELLLVSNRLGAEANQNPLDRFLLSHRPTPSRPLDVELGGQLKVLGWDVLYDGRPADVVEPGRSYDFEIYYEVLRPVTGDWKTFIHIDGFQRRFNGDHETLGGRYPFDLWQRGDIIRDTHPFRLGPNFTAGTYSVYFGLFKGKKRLRVSRGKHDDDRIVAGKLRVR